MPQFDFYAWASVCFWTIVSFQIFYFLILYFFIVPASNLCKYIQKLISLFFKRYTKNFALKDTFLASYFSNVRVHYRVQSLDK